MADKEIAKLLQMEKKRQKNFMFSGLSQTDRNITTLESYK